MKRSVLIGAISIAAGLGIYAVMFWILYQITEFDALKILAACIFPAFMVTTWVCGILDEKIREDK